MMNVIVILDKHLVLYLFRGSFFALFKHYSFLLKNKKNVEIATLLYYKAGIAFQLLYWLSETSINKFQVQMLISILSS